MDKIVEAIESMVSDKLKQTDEISQDTKIKGLVLSERDAAKAKQTAANINKYQTTIKSIENSVATMISDFNWTPEERKSLKNFVSTIASVKYGLSALEDDLKNIAKKKSMQSNRFLKALQKK